MTPDTAAALAYLKEQMGEGWKCSLWQGKASEKWFADAGWIAGDGDGPLVCRIGPDPMSAARACVEAWREATEKERAAWHGFLVDECNHADRLAEALRDLATITKHPMDCAGACPTFVGQTGYCALCDARKTLAAHVARRSGEGGSK